MVRILMLHNQLWILHLSGIKMWMPYNDIHNSFLKSQKKLPHTAKRSVPKGIASGLYFLMLYQILLGLNME